MYKCKTAVGASTLLAAVLVLASCSSPLGPDRNGPGLPSFATAPPISSGLVLDQWNGSLNEGGLMPGTCDGNNPCLIKGFNPQNPHVGDAIIATFFWVGSTNVITSVTDHITDIYRTSVGNTYSLVSHVTEGGVSMATYVATNVQNFADAGTDPNQILAVRANLSQPVSDGGVVISAYRGLPVTVGAFASAQGSSNVPVTAAPGAISVAPGGLAYGVTMSGTLVGLNQPTAPFTYFAGLSDNYLKTDEEYALLSSGGVVNPEWTWFFSANQPGSWMATTVALNPAATRLFITGQPTTTLPLMTITPAVQVAAVDDLGNTVTTFNGSVTIAIGHNGGLVIPGTLSGTKTVNFVNGVATFSDLSIDQPGNGYTLVVSTSGLTGAQSASFNIGAM